MANLITILKEEIIDYYKDSDHYNNEEFIDEIPIPEEMYLNITKIKSTDQFNQLLDIFQYWGFYKLPDFVLGYVLKNKDNLNEIELNLYPEKNYYYKKKLLSFADMLNLMIKTKKEDIMNIFARIGNLNIFKYLHEYGYPCDLYTCSHAALGGNLECLKYARENGCPWVKRIICKIAALGGNLECLKYARKNGCPWDKDTCSNAALGGHLECLKYAHENGCPWDEITCLTAAKGGHLECLKYAHENGCPWDEDTCSYAAARRGTLECIKYAHENGCPWDEETIKSATRRGNLECLKYARENDCPYGS